MAYPQRGGYRGLKLCNRHLQPQEASPMATKAHFITPPRIVYQTPCGRVRVERDGPKDYSLYLDSIYARSFDRSWDAEHEGGMWLHEQAEALTAQLADEQAER